MRQQEVRTAEAARGFRRIEEEMQAQMTSMGKDEEAIATRTERQLQMAAQQVQEANSETTQCRQLKQQLGDKEKQLKQQQESHK